MKIKLKNLGAMNQAEFELGKLTIICGNNNTGKTYATYAFYGFLSFWRESFSISIPDAIVNQLMKEGTVEFDLDSYIKDASAILKDGCAAYTERLSTVFASSERKFEKSEFLIMLDTEDIQPLESFERNKSSEQAIIFNIMKIPDKLKVSVTLLVEKEKVRIPRMIIKREIGKAVREIIFDKLFPNPFIASAERTGAAIFRNELNFVRNRVLEQISTIEQKSNILDILRGYNTDYALPVKNNVEFTRRLEDIAKQESFISKDHKDILEHFSDIIGGEYNVVRDQLWYTPKTNNRLRLTMDESSSAVRSLLDIGFYLRHVAKHGDLLMIDEPELNLHPENQRRIARLFARLLNIGIKIFITTHSDYIIKELNTLIMLNNDKPYIRQIRESEGYLDDELISAKDVKVYIAEEAPILLNGNRRKTKCMTLVSADIDPELGIEARTFDTTIEDMNRIQESIIFEKEEV
jgi:predicted ATPase